MSETTPLSTLSLAVLGLVSQQPMSGYDLRKVFATTPMGHFSNSPGAIYPALRRLEQDGLLRGAPKPKDTLRPRRLYTLTKEGKTALTRRLTQPVTQDDVVWRLDDLLLRFAFMGDLVQREQALRFMREFVAEVGAYVSSLREHLDAERDSMSLHGRLALEHGVETYEATARWARRALRQLEQ
ncbi:MAG: PadR family transcriptional regulator [Planctomycetota bacterium]|jgi:DNA-binding PadR family transcriptional regulator